jgi:diguanylate cyclase (GGDEF)-like protein
LTNDVVRVIRSTLQRRRTSFLFAAGGGVFALVVGFFVGPTPGIAVGILMFMAAAVFALFLPPKQLDEEEEQIEADGADQSPGQTSNDASMKTLLFDDYQPNSGKYVVKEIEHEERVVPSSKTVKPVTIPIKRETLHSMDIHDFFDLDNDVPYAESDPRNEFHSLVNKVLLVVKDVLFANTVAFFWANGDKRQLVLEAVATDCQSFMTAKRFSFEGDFVSQVGETGKPEVLGSIAPGSERDVLRYYEQPADVRSALAVPVFFNSGAQPIKPVGVLVADSLVEDQFGEETLLLLGRFTKLISGLVKSYTDKYDLLLDSELLASLRRMHDRIGSNPTEDGVLSSLIDEATRLSTWECLTIVMHDDRQNGFVIQRAVNKGVQPYVGNGLVIDIEASIAGEVIRSNTLKSIDDLSVVHRPRFHGSEPPAVSGSFLSIPISSFNRCYGALALESRTTANFQGSEAGKLYRLVQAAALSLEVIFMNQLTREQLPFDTTTGALSANQFRRRVEEEVVRSAEFGEEMTLVSVAIDGLDGHVAKFGPEAADGAMIAVCNLLRSHLRPFDAIGRLGEDRFGALLIRTVANDAYVWGEKIRKLASNQVIAAGDKTFSATVSLGIGGLLDGMTAAELIDGTSRTLEKAIENGGNLVRVQ